MSSLISSNQNENTCSNPVEFSRSFQHVFCKVCKKFIPNSDPNVAESRRKEVPINFIANESIFHGVIARHLRQQHHIVAAKANSLEKAVALSSLQEEPLTRAEEERRLSYMKYYVKNDKHAEGWAEVLDEITDLSKIDAFQCSGCYHISTSMKYANAHKKNCGCEIKSIMAQSLFGGNKVRYFRVSDKVIGNSTCLSSMFFNVEGGSEIKNNSTSPSQRDPLLNILKFDVFLEDHKIPLEDAYSACRVFPDEFFKKKMESFLSDYIEKARNETIRNLFIQTHTFMESSIHLMIGAESVKRYSNSILFLLNFLQNITDEKSVFYNRDEKNVLIRDCIKRLNGNSWNLETSSSSFDDLHTIFKQLLFSNADTNTYYSIPAFINCFGLTSDNKGESDFRFINGAELSPLLAALLYLMKCTVVIELYVLSSENRAVEYRESTHAGWSYFKSITEQDRDCGATYIRYCMNVCNGIRSTEMSRIRFVKCQKHPQCAIIDGHEISIELIGCSIKSIQSDMEEKLDKNALLGFWNLLSNDFLADVLKLKDNWSNNNVYYWFGKHESNIPILHKWRDKFGQHLISKGFMNEDGKFDVNRCKIFLDTVEEFVEKLYVLLHIGSGSPPRGTELGVVQVCNGPHATRHIFMDQGQLLIVIKYHKGRDKLNGTSKPIARYTDKVTNRLLLTYLIFIRPLETLILRQLSPQGKRGTEDESNPFPTCPLFLFTSRGLLILENVLRKTFCRYLGEKGCNLNMSQYRQYFTGAVKHFNLMNCKNGEALLLELSDILHIQAGHSINTAHSIYGVSELDISSLDSVKLNQYRSASLSWQIAIGIHISEENEVEKGLKVEEKDQGNRKCNNVSVSLPVMEQMTESIREIQNDLSMMKKLLSNSVEFGQKCTSDYRDILPKTIKTVVKKKVNHEELALNALRQLTKNQNASYKSKEQKDAILTCLIGTKDGLFILPTGSGKSFTFMIAASLLTSGIIIVFVPLIALQLDIIRKCSETGIHAVRWEERHSAGAKIVLCSVENVTKDSYRSFVSEKYSLGTLAAIFFDEAHLLKHWEEFRGTMNQVEHYIRPSHVQVPIYGLTATCPPILQDSIIKSLSLRDPAVIRMNGTRKNISYNFFQVTKDTLNLKLVQTIIETVEEQESNGWKKTFRAIVYCQTREIAEECPKKIEFVMPTTIKLFHYHAGMKRSLRMDQQEKWAGDSDSVRCNVMFCTSAFGCGIDLPDVRLVVHLKLPNNIISYIQESGRAGRDGNPAKSIIFDLAGDYGQPQPAPSTSKEEDQDDIFEKKCEIWNYNSEERALYGSLNQWRDETLPSCRRILLDNYNEGVETIVTCIDRGLINCDVCNDLKFVTPLSKVRTFAMESQNNIISKDMELDKKLHGMSDSQSKSRRSSLHDSSRSPYSQGISQEDPGVFSRDGSLLQSNAVNRSPPIPKSQTPVSIPYYSQLREDGIKKVKLSPILSHDINNITNGNNMNVYSSFQNMKGENYQSKATEEKSKSSRVALFQQPRNDITAAELSEIALKLFNICPVCSGLNRRRINGCKNAEKTCFVKRCLKCGSRTHFLSSCFMKNWKHFVDSCRKCSMKSHGKCLIHEPGTYGRDCPHLNCLKLLIVIFENGPTRKSLNDSFPEAKNLSCLEDFLKWLRTSDEDDNTWYGTVLKWLGESFFLL